MAKQGSGGFKSSRGTKFGTLEQVFDDVWWAWGTTKMAPGISFGRNMTIVKDGDGLVVIHPVMMPPEEQAKIEALGPIKHVVRLGAMHGMDDKLYLDKYKAQMWAPPACDGVDGLKVDHPLRIGGELPIAGATLFDFEPSVTEEMALLVPRHGGVLITCDSVQNWETKNGCSFLAGVMTPMMGFKGRACIGPGWRKQFEPKDGVGFKKSFEQLLGLEFKHCVSAHGRPMKDTAKDDLRASVAKIYA